MQPPANSTLSVLELISHASVVVQLVLFLLIGFSVLGWAIIFSKGSFLKKAQKNSDKFLEIFWSGKNMEHIFSEAKKSTQNYCAKIFQSGYIELQKIFEKSKPDTPPPQISMLTNVERTLRKAARNESLKLESGLGFLASIGSTAPFIGLFGTVWGIMDAFKNIASSGGANLAVVAPGIAEALVATAIGLACAIPAVLGYNYYIQKTRILKTEMENFCEDFLNIVRRNFSS